MTSNESGVQIKTLGKIYDPKRNSFAFLRFCLATLVIFSHAYPLGAYLIEPFTVWSKGQESFGGVALSGFFILSGFLITSSYEHLQSFFRYMWHRYLRILPGYFVALLITAFFFGAIAYYHDHGTLSGFLHMAEGPFHYVKLNANLLLEVKTHSIGNLLSTVPYPPGFNGSLWTLVYEFRCYLITAVLGLFALLSKNKLVPLVIFFIVWMLYLINLANPGSAGQVIPYFADSTFLKLTTFYLAGTVMFLYKDKILMDTRTLLFMLFLGYISTTQGFYLTTAPVVLTFLIFWLGTHLPITKFDKYGDFSYGIYIYAFPIQQILSLYGYNNYSLKVYLFITFMITIVFAISSYHFVERPFLKLKNIQLTRVNTFINILKTKLHGPSERIKSYISTVK